MPKTHYRACNLCEAICGLAIEHEDGKILSIRGDKDDPFSRGHICPKAVALKDLHEDPARLRRPLRREPGTDRFVEVSWDEAFSDIGRRLRTVRKRHGRDALAFVQGNPVLHNYGSMIWAQILLPLFLRTRHRFSTVSLDNLPRMLVSRTLYGNQAILPVPDVDRTDYLLILGANPAVSNGSVMTAPDLAKRLTAIRERGGQVVLVDPRRNETAELASRHVFIRPSSDVYFLLSLLHVLFHDKLIRHRSTVPLEGWIALEQAVSAADYTPARTAAATGIDAATTTAIARELAAAPSACVYGRMGVSVQPHGALSTWLIDVINLVTGNFDRPGGAMFATPAVDLIGIANLVRMRGSFASYRSAVRGLPEFNGELPMATLAEEIEHGSIKAALLTATNPVLSAPNGNRIERALGSLECVVAVDFYLNETTRLAHYILPPTATLEHEHYDLGLYQLAVRNTARWNEALFPPADGALHDWQIFSRLLSEIAGSFYAGTVGAMLRRLTPERTTDLLLRAGPHRLSVAALREHPHGLDLGALEPRLPEILATDAGSVDLFPSLFADALAALPPPPHRPAGLLLIGRRDLRSNNSWMHNALRLVKGKPRCTLLIHPEDAEARGVRPGDVVEIESRTGAVLAPVEVSDAILPGVVSLPHGWGHHRAGTRLPVAEQYPGVSLNDLTDEAEIDELCGTSVLAGVPVTVTRVESA